LAEAELAKDPWNFAQYDVVILCETDDATSAAVNAVCRKNGVKFIAADCYGAFTRVFNDFGDKFEVLDKNGEELPDCNITKITIDEVATVELL
jgi:molybdopterin/thiamine biosynthesis adenylyltransferase